MTPEAEDTVEGSVRLLEKALDIREGFLESLKSEDDWSFIIKLHALIEAAISHLLCKTLRHDDLKEVFSSMELSDKRGGKLAFVKSLNLLDKTDRRFISSLSELRNRLVHDVSKVGFDLTAHVQTLTPKGLADFVKCHDSFSAGKKFQYKGVTITAKDLFKSEPKTALWYSAMETVAIIYQQKKLALATKALKDLQSNRP